MKGSTILCVATLALFAVGCNSSQTTTTTPTQPTPTPPVTPTTPTPPPPPPPPPPPLTLTAPQVDDPSDDLQLDTLRPTLRVNNVTSSQPEGGRHYEFQVADNAEFTRSAESFSYTFRVIVNKTSVPEGADGKTQYIVEEDLQPTTRFWWRARARQGDVFSEWSSTRRFKSKVMGYSRPGELFDPLTNGETLGARINQTTFVAGRGIRIDNFTSWVQYNLPETITAGEFSATIETPTRTPGDKTKLLSVYDGRGDIVDHPWRMTVEKRGDGTVAWRMIAGDQEDIQIDTIGNERRVVDLGNGGPHRWKASWGGGFGLRIIRESDNREIYDLGKGLGATYRPNPMVAHLGSPPGRSGPDSQSVPGALYRDVWIANRARPASLGSAIAVGR